MNEIYVTGHRNPDTDSIVAAMSYAALKNALGEKEYVAVHLGTISDETNRMLERFHFKPPRCIQNVRTQVQDLDFDRPPCLDASRRYPPSPWSMRTVHSMVCCPPATLPPSA